jgi:hypothetical protein
MQAKSGSLQTVGLFVVLGRLLNIQLPEKLVEGWVPVVRHVAHFRPSALVAATKGG